MWRTATFAAVARVLGPAGLGRRDRRDLALPLIGRAVAMVPTDEAAEVVAAIDWLMAAPETVARREWAATRAAVPFEDFPCLLAMLNEVRMGLALRAGIDAPAPGRRPAVWAQVVGALSLDLAAGDRSWPQMCAFGAATAFDDGEPGAHLFLDRLAALEAEGEAAIMAEWNAVWSLSTLRSPSETLRPDVVLAYLREVRRLIAERLERTPRSHVRPDRDDLRSTAAPAGSRVRRGRR